MRPGASRTLARLSVAHGSLAERDMRRWDCFAKANHNLDIKPFLGEVKEKKISKFSMYNSAMRARARACSLSHSYLSATAWRRPPLCLAATTRVDLAARIPRHLHKHAWLVTLVACAGLQA